MSVLRAFLVAAAVVATVAAAPAPAAAAPQSLGGDAVAGLALGPDGSAAAALLSFRGFSSELAVARAAPGAPFGPARRVFVADPDDRLYGSAGVAADGGGVAVFQRIHRPYARVRAATFAADGTAAPRRTISTPGHTARFPALAVAPSGEAVAAWLQFDGRAWFAEAAVRAPGAAAFGPVQRLSGALGRSTLLRVAVGSRGDAVVLWRPNGPAGELTAAVRPTGERFASPERVAADVVELRPVVRDDGAIAIALITSGGALPRPDAYPDAGTEAVLGVVTRPPGAEAAFRAPQRLDAGDDNGYALENLDAAVAGDRLAIAAGHSDVVAARPRFVLRNAVRVYEGAFGGELARTAELGAGARGSIGGTRIAVTQDGAAAVAWDAPVPNRPHDLTARGRLTIATRPAGGTFGAPQAAGAELQSSSPFALAPLPGGGLLATWSSFDTQALGRSGRAAYALRL